MLKLLRNHRTRRSRRRGSMMKTSRAICRIPSIKVNWKTKLNRSSAWNRDKVLKMIWLEQMIMSMSWSNISYSLRFLALRTMMSSCKSCLEVSTSSRNSWPTSPSLLAETWWLSWERLRRKRKVEAMHILSHAQILWNTPFCWLIFTFILKSRENSNTSKSANT